MGGEKIFLPCYTFHTFIIAKTSTLFEHYVCSFNSYTAPLYWIFVSILSVIISLLIMKIPYMNKVFRI